jgi:hypothetical protein
MKAPHKAAAGAEGHMSERFRKKRLLLSCGVIGLKKG